MLGAVMFGHEAQQAAINAIIELADEAGKDPWDWTAPAQPQALDRQDQRNGRQRHQRSVPHQVEVDALGETRRNQESRRHGTLHGEEGAPDKNTVTSLLFNIEAKIVRGQILNGEPRIDGRDTRTVRPISIRPAYCRAPTVRCCSPAAKRRRSWWRRWAR